MNNQNLKVGVVLLNWNGGEFTIPCIESLYAGKHKPYRIVVVDNGSNDGSPNSIKNSFPEVVLIRNKTNKGFAEGNNQGMGYLLENGMDFIWLLNNDTVVNRECLASLLRYAQQHPEVAGISGKIFYDNPPGKVWYGGAFRHPVHLVTKHLYNDLLDKSAFNGGAEVDFISGCCMFIPKKILIKYGGFYPEYVGYQEDSEWCWRLKDAGEKLLYVPAATLTHCISGSVWKNTGDKNIEKGTSPFAYYLLVRNNLWNIRIHVNCFPKKAIVLAVNMGIAFKMIFINLKLRFFYWRKIFAIGKGVVHGLTKALPVECSLLNAEPNNHAEKAGH